MKTRTIKVTLETGGPLCSVCRILKIVGAITIPVTNQDGSKYSKPGDKIEPSEAEALCETKGYEVTTVAAK